MVYLATAEKKTETKRSEGNKSVRLSDCVYQQAVPLELQVVRTLSLGIDGYERAVLVCSSSIELRIEFPPSEHPFRDSTAQHQCIRVFSDKPVDIWFLTSPGRSRKEHILGSANFDSPVARALGSTSGGGMAYDLSLLREMSSHMFTVRSG